MGGRSFRPRLLAENSTAAEEERERTSGTSKELRAHRQGTTAQLDPGYAVLGMLSGMATVALSEPLPGPERGPLKDRDMERSVLERGAGYGDNRSWPPWSVALVSPCACRSQDRSPKTSSSTANDVVDEREDGMRRIPHALPGKSHAQP